MVRFAYELIDVFVRHQIDETVNVPSPIVVASLKPGDRAKVGVEFPPLEVANARIVSEHFWVKVVEITPDEFVGQVDNFLVFTDQHGIDRGDVVSFRRKNVLEVSLRRY